MPFVFLFRSLRALVVKRDWSEIEEISKTKKSPIGWEVCISWSQIYSVSRRQITR